MGKETEKDTMTQRPRLKAKLFPGFPYQHATATVTFFNDEGVLQKFEFRLYPASHHAIVKRQQAEIAKGTDSSESALRPGRAIHAMQDDSTDYSEVLLGAYKFVENALFNKPVLLTKVQEMTDNGVMELQTASFTFPKENLPAIQDYLQKLESGTCAYSLIDGEERKHCGTALQDVIELAAKGTEAETLARRSSFERMTTTWPPSAFERAKTISEQQALKQDSGAEPKVQSPFTKLAPFLPLGELRRLSYSIGHLQTSKLKAASFQKRAADLPAESSKARATSASGISFFFQKRFLTSRAPKQLHFSLKSLKP